MKNFKLKIEQNHPKCNLTVIYKDGKNQLHEMKVPEKDILNNLQFFQKKVNEINLTHLIYIQEDIPFDIFQQFLASINTKEININDTNYESYLYLSSKYGYEDLHQSILNFISSRPDISSLINDITQNIEERSKSVEIIFDKEELLSKNLDICLQNKSMLKLPIDVINRILNSPNRVIKNHHILFLFVIEYIQFKTIEMSKEDEENISLIPRCLDYRLMNNDEIENLFEIEKKFSTIFFPPKNSEEKIKQMISSEKEIFKKYQMLEEKIQKMDDYIKNLERRVHDIEENCDESKKVESTCLEKVEKLIKSPLDEQILNVDRNQKNLEEGQKEIESQVEQHKLKIIAIEKDINEMKKKFNDQKEIVKKQQNPLNQVECYSGIFSYLFVKYRNIPVQSGIVAIFGNSNGSHYQNNLPKIIDPNFMKDRNVWSSENNPNSYLKIVFIKSLIRITSYKLLVAYYDGSGFFNSWLIKGITQDSNEIVLDDVNDLSSISRSNSEVVRNLSNSQFVHTIKLTLKKPNSCNDWRIILRNIEFYGSIQL